MELKPHRSGDWWRGLTVPSVTVNDVPLDLTGAVATFQVSNDSTSTVLLDASSDADVPGIQITAPNGPIVVLGRVVSLTPGKYTAALKVWPANGQPRTILVATWTITKKLVTRTDP